MIHPKIETIFPNDEESRKLFSLICSKATSVSQIEEFIRWHLDVNEEVVKEITRTQDINFLDESESKKWAAEFLESYDQRIRQMRYVSNRIFERFHHLKDKEFERIMHEDLEHKEKISNMMNEFLNKRELLIGKIIFAYRELWFLANHILDSSFKMGSVSKYKKWRGANISNLKGITSSLKLIENEISRWNKQNQGEAETK